MESEFTFIILPDPHCKIFHWGDKFFGGKNPWESINIDQTPAKLNNS